MSFAEWVKDDLYYLIPAIVSLIGIFAVYIATKKTVANELQKQKSDIYLSQLKNMPLDLIGICEDALTSFTKTYVKDEGVTSFTFDAKRLVREVTSFGSENAIKILPGIIQSSNKVLSEYEAKDYISYLILLFCQVKYDVTGIRVNPEYVYKSMASDLPFIDLNDYLITNNIIVRRYFLPSGLEIPKLHLWLDTYSLIVSRKAQNILIAIMIILGYIPPLTWNFILNDDNFIGKIILTLISSILLFTSAILYTARIKSRRMRTWFVCGCFIVAALVVLFYFISRQF